MDEKIRKELENSKKKMEEKSRQDSKIKDLSNEKRGIGSNNQKKKKRSDQITDTKSTIATQLEQGETVNLLGKTQNTNQQLLGLYDDMDITEEGLSVARTELEKLTQEKSKEASKDAKEEKTTDDEEGR